MTNLLRRYPVNGPNDGNSIFSNRLQKGFPEPTAISCSPGLLLGRGERHGIMDSTKGQSANLLSCSQNRI